MAVWEASEVLTRLAQEAKDHTMDNGQFTSKRLDQWAYLNGVEMDFSRPGKPTDNAMIEAFNGAECNESWFLSLEDAREKIEEWRTTTANVPTAPQPRPGDLPTQGFNDPRN